MSRIHRFIKKLRVFIAGVAFGVCLQVLLTLDDGELRLGLMIGMLLLGLLIAATDYALDERVRRQQISQKRESAHP